VSIYQITAHRPLAERRRLTCIAASPNAAALIGTMAFPGFLVTVKPRPFFPYLPPA
jgi:hypothetical protein